MRTKGLLGIDKRQPKLIIYLTFNRASSLPLPTAAMILILTPDKHSDCDKRRGRAKKKTTARLSIWMWPLPLNGRDNSYIIYNQRQ
jgi:hypothetical protein